MRFCFYFLRSGCFQSLGEVVGVLLSSASDSGLVGILGLADASVLRLNDLEVGGAARASSPSADGLLAPVVYKQINIKYDKTHQEWRHEPTVKK